MLLVYLVLAGQYESWYAPISVLLAVPLSLVGPALVLLVLRIDNNLYVQIGLVLLIALSAKNAILIVEVAREMRAEGKPIVESALRGGAGPVPAHPDDVVRVYPRRRAAGAGYGRRCVGAQIHRYHRLQRHARFDLSRGAVRALDVRGHSAVRGMARVAQGRREAGSSRTAPRIGSAMRPI